jgi:hypothetical protein
VKKAHWIVIGILLFAAFLGIMTMLMMGHRQNRVEVCMTFRGNTNCSTASGQTREDALRTATQAACTLISGGVTDSQACERSQPVSVKWLD